MNYQIKSLKQWCKQENVLRHLPDSRIEQCFRHRHRAHPVSRPDRQRTTLTPWLWSDWRCRRMTSAHFVGGTVVRPRWMPAMTSCWISHSQHCDDPANGATNRSPAGPSATTVAPGYLLSLCWTAYRNWRRPVECRKLIINLMIKNEPFWQSPSPHKIPDTYILVNRNKNKQNYHFFKIFYQQ